ncbi:AI-2E family transporter [Sanguibacter suaedae]|uniref:AI-2E family transporter n=1 Tax=Sanguibacter suaedae TaxID=2795737 RepID=UPI0027DBD0CC|nr:AI-2E family transporter [Sanguibacter suaedae]
MRRNTASIRPPATQTAPDSVPGWLVTSAGWSWRLILVTAAVLLVFVATSRVQLVFIAVFLALVLTAVLRPLVTVYARIMPRALATALAMLTGLLVVSGLVTYVVASVAGQWQSLSDQFASGTDQIFDFLEDGPLPVSITVADLQRWVDDAQQWVVDHAGDIAGTAFQQAGTVVKVFTTLALAIFTTVFFLARGEQMWTWFLNQLPARTRDAWTVVGDAGWYTFSGYTRGTVIIATSDGVLAGIFLSIIGVPLAMPLAVLVVLGGFVPLIGAPLAMLIAMVVALAADGIVKAAVVGIGIALIGQFEGHVLQPLVMGKQVSLHPVVVAVVVTGGTLLAGILGAVIAVPLVAVAWAVFAKLRTLDPPMDPDAGDDLADDTVQTDPPTVVTQEP